MPDAKIDGQSIKPMPGSVTSAMKRGYPKATAQSLPGAKKPTGTVRV